MKHPYSFALTAMASIFCFTEYVSAATSNVSPTAPTVYLRTICTEGVSPETTQANCFISIGELQTWIGSIRKPTASKPLRVEIGPGRFVAGFTCPEGVSNITLSGSGPENSFIGSSSTQAGLTTAPGSTSCSQLAVNDLTLEGGVWAVNWRSSGNTRWNNVTLRGGSYGWLDHNCPVNTRGKHYFFSSRILSGGGMLNPSKGYGSECGENWLFASEIVATGHTEDAAKGLYLNNSEAHVYGGVIRVIAAPGVTFLNAGTGPGASDNPASHEGQGLFAVLSSSNSEIHIHGTGIDVIGNELPNNIAAIMATSGGSIHANEAAYNLKTGTGGTITRILDENSPLDHKVHAPFLWGPHSVTPNVISTDGSDIAVVNEGTPRFVIYNNTCSSRWFDVGANACRP